MRKVILKLIILFFAVFILIVPPCLALDAEQDGAIYGDPQGLARVTAVETELHNLRIRTDHPRIFLNADNLPEYRARYASHRSWNSVLNKANSGDMLNAAFVYQMTGNSAYANIAIAKMKGIAGTDWPKSFFPNSGHAWEFSKYNIWQIPHTEVSKLALAFDWVYDALSDADKTYFINRISQLSDLDNRDLSTPIIGECFHWDGWASGFEQAWPEIALAHHHPKAESIYLARWRYNWMWGDAIRLYAYLNGSIPDSYDFPIHGVTMWLLPLATSTGVNIFTNTKYPYFEKIAISYLYRTDFYHNYELFHRGSYDGMPNVKKIRRDRAQSAILSSGGLSNSPFIQWYIDYIGASIGGYYTWGSITGDWIDVILYNNAAEKKAPVETNIDELPLSWTSSDEVYIRTGWNREKETFIGFRAGRSVMHHGHNDANTFLIYRDGIISGDTGMYDGYTGQTQLYGYHVTTTSHNDMLIENNNLGELDSLWVRSFGAPYIVGEVYLHEEALDGKKLTKFETNADYTYAEGDATKAYGTRANKVLRKIVFILKDTKAYFITFDLVDTTDASFEKRWLIHFVDKPIVNGNKVSEEVVGHIDTYDGDLTYANNAKDTSRIFIKTLSPGEHNIKRIGGDGYEFWRGGKNYPAPFPDSIDGQDILGSYLGAEYAELGNWRIEITPSTQQKKDNFLNVMYIADVTDSMPTIVRIDTTLGNMVGTHIKDSTKEWITMFSKTDNLQNSLTYDASYIGTAKHLIADMQSGTYNIYRNGQLITTKTASSQNTLYFESNDGGTFTITQGQASFHPADINQNNIIEMKELIAFIGLWKQGNANVNDVMTALGRWMRGV